MHPNSMVPRELANYKLKMIEQSAKICVPSVDLLTWTFEHTHQYLDKPVCIIL